MIVVDIPKYCRKSNWYYVVTGDNERVFFSMKSHDSHLKLRDATFKRQPIAISIATDFFGCLKAVIYNNRITCANAVVNAGCFRREL